LLQKIKRWFAGEEKLEMAEGERYLIAGLGNPGKKHRNNRHNIGFMTVDRLAEQNGIALGKVQSKAVVGSGRIAGRQVILAKPQTYMNRSGDSVGPLANYYRIPQENVLVIYDELDLRFGTLRLRQSGGSGGHNGMKSIINHLGQEFARLRLGIGRPPGRMEPADFVLSDFRGQELEVADTLLDDAVAAVESYLTDGIDLAMTKHNRAVDSER
jgi:PTH1 family peptidyl-tRNA hydrolase